MSEDIFRQRIFTTSDGKQIYVQDTQQISISISADDYHVVKERPLDELTPAEVEEIFSNNRPNDTISNRNTLMPKTTSTYNKKRKQRSA